jgi:hypothetical protein
MPPNASDTLQVEIDEDPPRSRHLRQRASELGGAFHRKSDDKAVVVLAVWGSVKGSKPNL